MEVQQCVYLLQQFLNKPRDTTDYAALESYLPQFFQCLTGSIGVRVVKTEDHCSICQGPVGDERTALRLGCRKSHFACGWNCAALYVDQSFWVGKTEYRSIPCPTCQTPLSAQLCETILHYYSGQYPQQAAPSSVPEVQNEPAPKPLHEFLCDICYDKGYVEDEVSLWCGDNHTFHRACLADFFDNLVSERKVSDKDVTCPKCQHPIEPQVLRAISPVKYAEYEVLATRMAAQEIVGTDEKVSFCPKCQTYVIVDKSITSVSCQNPVCNYAYCVKCGKPLHSGPCDVEAEEGLAKWMEQQGNALVRSCPKCHQVIFRDEGCKFMTCKSELCKGATFFCMACGKLLGTKHENHPCVVEGKDYRGSRIKHYTGCEMM